ncbi:hypothetical protein NE237_018170 [Protea cynaroides]|uniref:Uncharacterized protein n=1 Tax=Protea cynaroides TaxID=273540 RepID=A0A9Q0K9J1_9MAGN|nr:hypothetical protein NE237_018170 [Protea cynaroides]
MVAGGFDFHSLEKGGNISFEKTKSKEEALQEDDEEEALRSGRWIKRSDESFSKVANNCDTLPKLKHLKLECSVEIAAANSLDGSIGADEFSYSKLSYVVLFDASAVVVLWSLRTIVGVTRIYPVLYKERLNNNGGLVVRSERMVAKMVQLYNQRGCHV